MSVGVPNFPILLGHLGWGLLGNWETGKYVPPAISQRPNFPNSPEPSWLGSSGKLGNMYLKPFPIPSFLNNAKPDGLGSFGKLGIWEMDWARFVYKQRVCLLTRPWGTNQFPKIKPMSVCKRKVCL